LYIKTQRAYRIIPPSQRLLAKSSICISHRSFSKVSYSPNQYLFAKGFVGQVTVYLQLRNFSSDGISSTTNLPAVGLSDRIKAQRAGHSIPPSHRLLAKSRVLQVNVHLQNYYFQVGVFLPINIFS
jgi:hypothetical protein